MQGFFMTMKVFPKKYRCNRFLGILYDVIPAQAGIQTQKSVAFSKIFSLHYFWIPASVGMTPRYTFRLLAPAIRNIGYH